MRQRFGKLTSPSRGEVAAKQRVGVPSSSFDAAFILKPDGNVKPFTRATEQFAKALRKGQTDAESALWQQLRNSQLGVKFRRQQPFGKYIFDFVSMDAKLIVEVDGGQHNGSAHDAARDAFLRGEGFSVLRFWNNDVLENIEGVCVRIAEAIAASEPPPALRATSPLEGEVSLDPTEINSSFSGEVSLRASGDTI
jgi:very-short-patch-repair endonuclease